MAFSNGKRIIAHFSGWLTLLLFSLYLANVLQGKARAEFGWQPVFLFHDRIEFLLLLSTAVGFAVTILVREARAVQRDTPPGGDTP